MRILISSCLPLDYGGYPNQLNYLMGNLHKEGVELGVACWNFTYPWQEKAVNLSEILAIDEFKNISEDLDMNVYKNIRIYTTWESKGNYHNFWKKLEGFINDFQPDILFVYQDILVFPNYNIGRLPCKKYLWLPVHDNFKENPLVPSHISDPDSLYIDSTLRYLPLFDKIACFSQFGQDVLASYNYNATLITHAISAKLWKPCENRYIYRKKLNIPEICFVCLIVASNTELSNRKAFDYNMRAFAKFYHQYKESTNIRLIIKSNMNGVANLWELAKILGISDVTLNVPGKIPQKDLSIIYGISDVLLSASKSEGFGIPIIESQLCGVPVITTECTAMPENTYLGTCTKPKDVSLTIGKHNSWSHPDDNEIYLAIERIYKGNFEISSKIPTEKYDPELLWKKWRDFFEIH